MALTTNYVVGVAGARGPRTASTRAITASTIAMSGRAIHTMCMPIIQGHHWSHPSIIGPYIAVTPESAER